MGQIYLAGEAFVQQMAARAENNLDMLEVPRAQRRPRAQPLSRLVDDYADHPKEGIIRAYVTGDYALAQAAKAFGVHSSTVSRAVSDKRKSQGIAHLDEADRRIAR